MADLLIRNARLVATVDAERRELAGGWVSITGNLIEAVGVGAEPAAAEVIDASDCLVTPGLVNTHHHMYQNLTRAYPPMTDKPLFGWLQSLYPLWRGIDEESVHASAFVGLAELALSGCTTSSFAPASDGCFTVEMAVPSTEAICMVTQAPRGCGDRRRACSGAGG